MPIATIRLGVSDAKYVIAVLATRPYNEVASLIPVIEDAVFRAAEPYEDPAEPYEDPAEEHEE